MNIVDGLWVLGIGDKQGLCMMGVGLWSDMSLGGVQHNSCAE